MNQFNLQKVFSTIVTHLRTQNERASSPGGTCYYRAENGNMCAIGCLITDNFYYQELEDQASYAEPVQRAIASSLNVSLETIQDNREFFQRMQRIHDSASIVSWEEKFHDIASFFSLTVPEKV